MVIRAGARWRYDRETMTIPAENTYGGIVAARKEILERWNRLDPELAAEAVLPCCGSWAWAREMARRRPLLDEAEVFAAADAVWWSCGEADWREAFRCHPRIGERHVDPVATQRSIAWSSEEQSKAVGDDEQTARLLQRGNHAYEAKFGMTFLVCANGKSGVEILQVLHDRMRNDAQAELAEAAEQQREITALRLSRWLEER